MKILGIGVDIIQNNRIKKSIKNHKFRDRIYSINELKLSISSKNKIEYFSKRFAAKEAFAKALGTGFRNNLNFKDIITFKNKKNLQRWNKKENNSHLISNPVGCIKQIDIKNIIELIKYKMKEHQ